MPDPCISNHNRVARMWSNVDICGFSVNYKVELYDPRSGGFMPSTPGIGMHVEVRDPNDKVLMSRVYSSEGMISFTSVTPGEHVICMYSNSTSWFSGSQLRVSIMWKKRRMVCVPIGAKNPFFIFAAILSSINSILAMKHFLEQ